MENYEFEWKMSKNAMEGMKNVKTEIKTLVFLNYRDSNARNQFNGFHTRIILHTIEIVIKKIRKVFTEKRKNLCLLMNHN